jgi:hypothetical protein
MRLLAAALNVYRDRCMTVEVPIERLAGDPRALIELIDTVGVAPVR